MSVSVSSRTWVAEGGYDGEGWTRRQLDDFGALMEAASVKPRGRPALVTEWMRSRGCVCWYNAHSGPEEVALRNKCRAIFGARERSLGPDLRELLRRDRNRVTNGENPASPTASAGSHLPPEKVLLQTRIGGSET